VVQTHSFVSFRSVHRFCFAMLHCFLYGVVKCLISLFYEDGRRLRLFDHHAIHSTDCNSIDILEIDEFVHRRCRISINIAHFYVLFA